MGYDTSESGAKGVGEGEYECEALVYRIELVEMGRCVVVGV